MQKRHVNIPIFIPHLGCPNSCVFCNQRTISGVKEFELFKVRDIIESSLSTVTDEDECEIAFFGGSFTGIDRDLMLSLLELASEYRRSGRVHSIRCSTRPDYIDDEILDILEKYGVGTVELGLQSSSDKVLSISKRGHSFEHEEQACRLIVSRGFSLVGQMMIGLPGSTLEDEIATAEFIIKSGAHGARIYPTVVFRDTELCDMTSRGVYTPLSVDEAVMRSGAVLKRFYNAGVKVIRIGLCASENLSSDDTYFAGPNHSALGELVENELFYINIREKLLSCGIKSGDCVLIKIPKGATSKAIGHKKKNRIRLLSEFPDISLHFAESEVLKGYDVETEREERTYKCI